MIIWKPTKLRSVIRKCWCILFFYKSGIQLFDMCSKAKMRCFAVDQFLGECNFPKEISAFHTALIAKFHTV